MLDTCQQTGSKIDGKEVQQQCALLVDYLQHWCRVCCLCIGKQHRINVLHNGLQLHADRLHPVGLQGMQQAAAVCSSSGSLQTVASRRSTQRSGSTTSGKQAGVAAVLIVLSAGGVCVAASAATWRMLGAMCMLLLVQDNCTYQATSLRSSIQDGPVYANTP